MDSGVFMNCMSGRRNTSEISVSMIVISKSSFIMPAIEAFIFFLSCDPKHCVTTIAHQLLKPDAKSMRRAYKEDVTPIAAIAEFPRLYPATIVSTIL